MKEENTEEIYGVSVTFFREHNKVGFRFVYNGEPYGRHTIVTSGDPAKTAGTMKELAKYIIKELHRNVGTAAE